VCNNECLEFGVRNLTEHEVRGKAVLEVGARVHQQLDFTLRDVAGALAPASYLGVDIEDGPGVDTICDAVELRTRFGDNKFDLVISTEVLEHVRDWRLVVSNLKNVLRPGGVLLVTTRSRGFSYHAYPCDYWRYEPSDMAAIFGDLEVSLLKVDPLAPGVFMKAVKPANFEELDLTEYALYSIITGTRRTDAINPVYERVFRAQYNLLRRVLPVRIRRIAKQTLFASR
jgi:SAM-dependent methyltransferase